MRSDETIKFFTTDERNSFFRVLEKKAKNAETDFSKKIAVRNEAMFKIIYYCALRVSESTLIKIENYNNLRDEIYCKRLKGGRNNTLKIIDEDILKSLEQHLKVNKPTSALFYNFHNNKPLSRKTLDVIFKKTCKFAKIQADDKWHNHTLRHTRAIDLAESGLDLKELQYWLGHVHISNTEIYFQFTSKQQETMYQKLKKSKRRKKNE